MQNALHGGLPPCPTLLHDLIDIELETKDIIHEHFLFSDATRLRHKDKAQDLKIQKLEAQITKLAKPTATTSAGKETKNPTGTSKDKRPQVCLDFARDAASFNGQTLHYWPKSFPPKIKNMLLERVPVTHVPSTIVPPGGSVIATTRSIRTPRQAPNSPTASAVSSLFGNEDNA